MAGGVKRISYCRRRSYDSAGRRNLIHNKIASPAINFTGIRHGLVAKSQIQVQIRREVHLIAHVTSIIGDSPGFPGIGLSVHAYIESSSHVRGGASTKAAGDSLQETLERGKFICS